MHCKSRDKSMMMYAVLFIAFLIGMGTLCTCMRRKSMHSRDGNRRVRFDTPGDGKTYRVYGRMNCPYTVKMVDELDNNAAKYSFIDTTTESGDKEFRDILGGERAGVPFTVCNETGERTRGFVSYSKLSGN